MAEPAPLSPGTEERVRFIEHLGKRILFHDFSSIMNPADAFGRIALSKAIVATQEPRSLLTLTWVHGSRFNKEIIEALKDLVIHNKPYVRHGAIAGLSGLQRVIYVTLTQLTGRRLKTFDTIEEAKDWLAIQD